MRKLILIAAIALMSTSSCYANLTLADASQPAVAQVKLTADTQPVAEETSPSISRPRRKHVSAASRFTYRWSEHCW